MTDLDTMDALSLQRLEMLNSPGAMYLGVEDNLRITTFNSQAGVTLAIRARVLMADRRVVPCGDVHTPLATRLTAQSDILTPEGWLQDVEVFATAGAPRRGQCWVIVEVIRGTGSAATVLHTLIQDYAQGVSRIAWPNTGLRSSVEGPGNMRSVLGTDPAANVEIVETIPANARVRLAAFDATLVTDATVPVRTVAILIDDGANNLIRSLASITQAASLAVPYSVGEWGVVTGAAGVIIPIPLPTGLMLAQGFRIQTFTVARAAGDNWGAPRMLWEEWIETAT